MDVDTTNIYPLRDVFGPSWPSVDVLRLKDPDIRPQLLRDENIAQRRVLTQAINAVIRSLMTRYNIRNLYALADMRERYQTCAIANLGKTGRIYLDTLFGVRSAEQATPGPCYTYPLTTLSGIAYCDPVTDYNAGNYCQKCPHLEQCREIVTQRDGLALCEIILESELMQEVRYAA